LGILIQSGFSNKSHSQAMHDFPGVNFTNILQAVFVHKDSKSAKDTDDLTVFECLRSACLKAASKTLVKLTPGLRIKTQGCILWPKCWFKLLRPKRQGVLKILWLGPRIFSIRLSRIKKEAQAFYRFKKIVDIRSY